MLGWASPLAGLTCSRSLSSATPVTGPAIPPRNRPGKGTHDGARLSHAALKQEAAKAKDANHGVIARLVEGLVGLAPAAADQLIGGGIEALWNFVIRNSGVAQLY